MSREAKQVINQEHSIGDIHEPHRSADVDAPVAAKGWWASWVDEVDEEAIAPAVMLPWRIALFLFTSTLVQNFSYSMTSFLNIYGTDWTPGEINQFGQLAYNMLYLGPVFGLIVDLVRVFRERYRPVIVVACIVNTLLCLLCVGIPTMNQHYGRSLVIEWLMQVATIFIYIPMNAVVISYGNSMLESADESSARIGGLMAQAMVVRTFGSLIYKFIYVFGRPHMSATNPDRWMLLIGGVGSFVLIVQVMLPITMRRRYFVDYREASLTHSALVRFYVSAIRAHRNALSRKGSEATNTTFMFILCFIFIYFMLPDTLYNTIYSFNSLFTPTFSVGLNQAISILVSLGAFIGALAYALWMYFAHQTERKHRRLAKTNPFQIVLAGCSAWALGTLVHLIGVACHTHSSFSAKVFIPFQAFLVQVFLRFAFMPTLSLAAMHAPAGYETTAFELYSVDTSGGGTVSAPVTDALFKSLGVQDYFSGTYDWSQYWKGVLLCVFFQFLPLLIALSLPKHRDAARNHDSVEHEAEECEPLRDEAADQ